MWTAAAWAVVQAPRTCDYSPTPHRRRPPAHLRDLSGRAQQRPQRDLVVPLAAALEQALGDGLVQRAAVAVLRQGGGFTFMTS